jgi:hypothetical protein
MPTSINPTKYTIELRDKNRNLRQYIHPFVSDVQWEWNRFGGCGHCSITIKKGYRDIIFNARDDIRIRVENGSTTKLVYRGYIENITPVLQPNQNIKLDIYGYFNLFKRLIIQDAGDIKEYTSSELSVIVNNIIDTFVTPNSPITKGTIDVGTFVADSIQFLTTVEEALTTLATLAGNVEYGVDENLVFFWRTESEIIHRKFFVGDNISNLERRVDWSKLVNRIYLVGGTVVGSKYKRTAEATESQDLYYLSEKIVNNGSIITDTVADQYLGTLLSNNANPLFNIKAKILNTNIRIEDTVPLGLIAFYDVNYDRNSLGDIIGDIIGAESVIISSSIANPTVITATNHGFINGEIVIISGHTGSTPNINGSHTITYINANSFSIPVNVTVGGTGGVATSSPENGSNIRIGLTGDGGDNTTVGSYFSAQIKRIAYNLSNTAGRFNIIIELGDTILETAAKIKRLELALNNLQQY